MRNPNDIIKRKVFTDVLGKDYNLSQEQYNQLNEFINSKYFTNNSLLRIRYFIKYNLSNYIERYKSCLHQGKGTTLKKLQTMYGIDEGNIRWKKYLESQRYSNTLEYKKNKHGWTEKEFNDFNKSRAVTKENLISKYGEELGMVRWEKYINRQRYTNSKEYFIESFGETLGYNKWLEYNHKKGSSMRINDIMSKENISLDEAIEKIRSRKTFFSSNLEKEFVEWLELSLGINFKYSYKTKQFCLWDKTNNRPYFYDIVDIKNKIIIEFNGNFWHSCPLTYDIDWINPVSNKSSKEIREYDSNKIMTANDIGYKVIIIWENEYLSNKEKILKRIKDVYHKKNKS